VRYFAGADLAFASDSSALAVVYAADGGFRVACLEELRPKKGAPLRPKHVIDTFCGRMRTWGIRAMFADGHYRESAREHLEPHGISFKDAPGGREGKERVYLNARKLLHEGRVRIPRHPRLLAQLRSVVSKDVPGGGVTISSPRRAGGGHGDLVSALVLALWAGSRVKDKKHSTVPSPNIGPSYENRPIIPVGDSFVRLEGGGIHIGPRRGREQPRDLESEYFAAADELGDPMSPNPPDPRHRQLSGLSFRTPT
jgi:hypothetical protein